LTKPARPSLAQRLLAGVAQCIALVVILCHAVYRESETRLESVRQINVESLTSSADRKTLERGRHLGEVVAQCTFCHADDWGGTRITDDLVVGRLYSSNLTSGRGGIAKRYRDHDLVRAIRHGVNPAGKNLWFMPSEHFVAISDEDLSSLIVYIRALPPVDRVAPARWAGPAGRLAVVLDLAPELIARDPIAKRGDAHRPSTRDTVRYGEYLVSVGICGTCHRANLAGGRHPLAPPHEPVPPDLTRGGALARWSREDFIHTLRTGVTPSGTPLDPQFMPWDKYAAMSDEELSAMWTFLERLPGATGDEAPLGLAAVSTPVPRVTPGRDRANGASRPPP
jgi:cytochrome c553